MIFFLIFMFNPIHGKFLTNPQAPAFVLLRHIRFPTDDQQYKIHCPYNLNHLTLQLLNYSNTYCFNLYSVYKCMSKPRISMLLPCQISSTSLQSSFLFRLRRYFLSMFLQVRFRTKKTVYLQV